MASLACPVCDLIFSVEQPACTALVAKPARRLWPEKPAGSMLAAATRSLTISDTASPDSRSEARRPCPVDGPEDRAGVDPGNGKPTVEGERHWPSVQLIVLRKTGPETELPHFRL